MPAQILIVEDEPLLAMAMTEQLREAGFEITGVAPTLAKAMALLDRGKCDAVILDCTLRGESVEPLAMTLTQRGIPFLFYSGGCGEDIPERFRDTPLLKKPASGGELIAALSARLAHNCG